MATTSNSYANPTYFDGEKHLLLDELFLILNSGEHTTSIYGDILIYVHGKPHCHNICKKDTGANRTNHKKMLGAKMMTEIRSLKGGKSFAC
jgi:hypothetical protein